MGNETRGIVIVRRPTFLPPSDLPADPRPFEVRIQERNELLGVVNALLAELCEPLAWFDRVWDRLRKAKSRIETALQAAERDAVPKRGIRSVRRSGQPVPNVHRQLARLEKLPRAKAKVASAETRLAVEFLPLIERRDDLLADWERILRGNARLLRDLRERDVAAVAAFQAKRPSVIVTLQSDATDAPQNQADSNWLPGFRRPQVIDVAKTYISPEA